MKAFETRRRSLDVSFEGRVSCQADDWKWPGRAEAAVKFVAGKPPFAGTPKQVFRAGRDGRLVAGFDLSGAGSRWPQGNANRSALTRLTVHDLVTGGQHAWPRVKALARLRAQGAEISQMRSALEPRGN
jgi:hypothetical protein